MSEKQRYKQYVGHKREGALVSVIMGSQSDWDTMKLACETLEKLEIPWECKIISAHRTPDRMMKYAHDAKGRGIQVIIAGAGGAAHLPGMVAGSTSLPVLGVPILSSALRGMDSLLSIVQMPRGVPTATFSIGAAGAVNTALFAARILALSISSIEGSVINYIQEQNMAVAKVPTDDEYQL